LKTALPSPINTSRALVSALVAQVNASGHAAGPTASATSSGTQLQPGLRQYADLAAAALRPPAPAAAGETIHLSATARLLTLADTAANTKSENAAAPLIRASISQPTLAAGGVRLAEAVRLTLEESGLFYESHLREWVAGERAESVVLREAARREASGQAHIDMGNLKQQVGLLLNPHLELELAHANGRFSLSISPDSAAHQSASAEPRVWHIRIETQLPTLGRLVMQLALKGQSLNLVAQHHDAVMVQSAWPRLAARLRGAGFELASPRWEYLQP
jgi:hypothetical protein